MTKVSAFANRLVLMRHAKSDWYSGADGDFLRPLSARGRSDARRMGIWLAGADLIPASVLSSPARRTRETVKLVGSGMQVDLESRCEWAENLYHSSVDSLLDGLIAHDRDDDVLVVGHNPGLEELLHWLVPATDLPHDYNKQFPTGAVYVLGCAEPLTALTRGCARIEAHQRPKQLSTDA